VPSRRTVYATTNVRVPLRFAVNGHRMGSEVALHGVRTLQVWAASECEIARVDIIRNGEVLASAEPNATEVGWTVEDGGDRRVDWYYVRLRRADGQMAWSSPIWVEAT